MPVRIVQSKQNARLKELRRALTRPSRDDRGLVAIEGPHLLEEALRAGLRVHCIFLAQQSEDLLRTMIAPPATEVLLTAPGLLEDALSTETPQPVAALLEPPDWTWAHLLNPHANASALIVVLAGIQDPGNLGTILRSAEAFGAHGVVRLPGTVSEWNPKAIRASAGSVLRVPVIATTAANCFEQLREASVHVLATAVRQATPVGEANLTGPVAFLIGNEGNGVPAEIASHAHESLTIPCPGPVESLNAAVALSLLLYETSRQRNAVDRGNHEPLLGSVR